MRRCANVEMLHVGENLVGAIATFDDNLTGRREHGMKFIPDCATGRLGQYKMPHNGICQPAVVIIPAKCHARCANMRVMQRNLHIGGWVRTDNRCFILVVLCQGRYHHQPDHCHDENQGKDSMLHVIYPPHEKTRVFVESLRWQPNHHGSRKAPTDFMLCVPRFHAVCLFQTGLVLRRTAVVPVVILTFYINNAFCQ